MKVAFYKDKGELFDYLVRFWTSTFYEKIMFKWRRVPSHCELVFSDDMWFSSSPRDGGCRYKQISFDNSKWDFINIGMSEDQEREIRNFCDSINGKKYDWIGILFTQFIPLHIDETNRYFCSEACSEALQKAGITTRFISSSLSPYDLKEILLSH
jgi:hypothetical protein